jgi:hypothetical protein
MSIIFGCVIIYTNLPAVHSIEKECDTIDLSVANDVYMKECVGRMGAGSEGEKKKKSEMP